jgi:glycosyltransferase involved in cell wall biosynthesis
VLLSVVIITHNEEVNIDRTLKSVMPLVSEGKGEIIVVDSGSTDHTVEIAKSYGAKVFTEAWKGFAGQKNSAIEKAQGDWILSLDADEEVDQEFIQWVKGWSRPDKIEGAEWRLSMEAGDIKHVRGNLVGFWLTRKNYFLGRWIKHGGFWPDPKLRLFRRGTGNVQQTLVHETIKVSGHTEKLNCGLIHHSYPTISDYVEHMNRYSSLGAETLVAKGPRHLLFLDILFRPFLTFIYNYFFRRGFLDGREGLLLHLGHAVYVSWKYGKVWESQRKAC